MMSPRLFGPGNLGIIILGKALSPDISRKAHL